MIKIKRLGLISAPARFQKMTARKKIVLSIPSPKPTSVTSNSSKTFPSSSSAFDVSLKKEKKNAINASLFYTLYSFTPQTLFPKLRVMRTRILSDIKKYKQLQQISSQKMDMRSDQKKWKNALDSQHLFHFLKLSFFIRTFPTLSSFLLRALPLGTPPSSYQIDLQILEQFNRLPQHSAQYLYKWLTFAVPSLKPRHILSTTLLIQFANGSTVQRQSLKQLEESLQSEEVTLAMGIYFGVSLSGGTSAINRRLKKYFDILMMQDRAINDEELMKLPTEQLASLVADRKMYANMCRADLLTALRRWRALAETVEEEDKEENFGEEKGGIGRRGIGWKLMLYSRIFAYRFQQKFMQIIAVDPTKHGGYCLTESDKKNIK